MSDLLVAYGHSWVQGDGASAPERCMVSRAARPLGLAADNRGVGGTSSTHTQGLVQVTPPPPAAAYLIMTGLNDSRLHGTDPLALRAYADALRAVVAASQHASTRAPVLVVEQPPLLDYSLHPPHDQGSTEAVRLYNGAIRTTLAGLPGVHVVSSPDWDPATMLDEDTVHPNDRGHTYLAHEVVRTYRAASIGRTSPVQL